MTEATDEESGSSGIGYGLGGNSTVGLPIPPAAGPELLNF